MKIRSIITCCVALLAQLSTTGAATAQSFPSRSLTLVVPFPAGGPTDAIGRIMAEGMRGALGQTIIVENVPGATGSIAAGRVARSEPDGHTLILGTIATHVFNGAAYALKYDLMSDFTPVGLVALDPQVIAVKNSLPVGSLKELIGWLKANPDKATAGTAGVGSTAHIGAVRFQQLTGTSFSFVPYRGLGPAMQDLVSGQIDIVFGLAANTVPLVQSGKVKGLAVTAGQRLSSAPNTPTVDEAGLTGFHFINWHGIWAPRGIPPAVADRLNAALNQALSHPETAKRLADIGQQLPSPGQRSAKALSAYQQDEITRWWPVIKAANIKGS